MSLPWSLAVATLNREDILLRSLRANVHQTRPPSQVIVVDSSENWQRTRDRVMAEVAPEGPDVESICLGSDVRSSFHQRNLGFARCKGDVVILDDDSFMYRDCAEHVMRVYEADDKEAIGGVSTTLADRLEDEPAPRGGPPRSPSRRVGGLLMQLAQRMWWQDRLFIPYDGRFYLRDVEGLAADVIPRPPVSGMPHDVPHERGSRSGRLRGDVIRTAYGEDIDLSYRVSRDRALVLAEKATLRHEQVPVQRPKRELIRRSCCSMPSRSSS